MPERSHVIAALSYDASTLELLALGTLQSLGWDTLYAVENKIFGYTPGKWKKHSCEIKIEAVDNELHITSKMLHDQLIDVTGRNKKNIDIFTKEFEKIKLNPQAQQLEKWNEEIIQLKANTIQQAEKEIQEAQEVDSVMNFSKSNLYVTYALIAINVVVFVAMAISGVNVMSPTGYDIILWGGNYSSLTLSGDWWRLLTCVFIHIGIIHLLFNMYALYMIGTYLEPLLGKSQYIIAYICTGIFASLASLWWHDIPVASAGASGAIFGMYGIFLAFLTTNLIPKKLRNALLQSILVFIGFNLLYGMKAGIDNAAHAGGLISGMLIGYLLYAAKKKSENNASKTVSMLVPLLLAIVAGYFFLEQNRVTPRERTEVLKGIDFSQQKDAVSFNNKYNKVIELQDTALAALSNIILPANGLEKIKSVIMPAWTEAARLAEELKSMEVDTASKQKAATLQDYIRLRIEETSIIEKQLSSPGVDYTDERNAIVEKLNNAVEALGR